MSTVTFQIEEKKAEQLAEAARQRGLGVDELLRQITDAFLSCPTASADAAFKSALAGSVGENEELLRRLAR